MFQPDFVKDGVRISLERYRKSPEGPLRSKYPEAAGMSRKAIEGVFKLKRTLLLLSLAATGAGLAALPAAGQVNPEAAPAQAQAAPYKYEVYAGVAYSRLRQVPVSFSGLVGGKVSLARDWGKYFQLMGSVDYYKLGTGHKSLTESGRPIDLYIHGGPGNSRYAL